MICQSFTNEKERPLTVTPALATLATLAEAWDAARCAGSHGVPIGCAARGPGGVRLCVFSLIDWRSVPGMENKDSWGEQLQFGH